MRFNIDKFNLSPFNIGNEDNNGLKLVKAQIKFVASKPLLKLNTQLKLNKANVVFKATCKLTVKTTLELNPANIKFDANALLTVRTPLHLKPVEIKFICSKVDIGKFDLSTITLDGLVLKPNQMLTIDNDKITITVDGVNAIEYWKTGSVPFNFANGINTLTFSDDDAERTANVSVVYRNRWL